MRHETRSEAQDRRAEQQFAATSGLNGVDAELARPGVIYPTRDNCLAEPCVAGSCPHVTPSLCARHGPHQEPHDPCPWITFYTDAGGYQKLDEHPCSRTAAQAAVDRNCQWGRVITVFPSGNFVVEHGYGMPL